MITLIKAIHSVVFLAIATSLGIISWAAVTGRPSRITWIALAVVSVEIAAVAMARGSCPLTAFTERLGATSGSIVELFLPRWLASRAFTVGGAVFVTALFVLSIRLALASN